MVGQVELGGDGARRHDLEHQLSRLRDGWTRTWCSSAPTPRYMRSYRRSTRRCGPIPSLGADGLSSSGIIYLSRPTLTGQSDATILAFNKPIEQVAIKA